MSGNASIGAVYIHHIPFISYWAIMAMEPVGFAKANLKQLWFDHSLAVSHSCYWINTPFGRKDAFVQLPAVTLGSGIVLEQSISDWKRKYLDECSNCDEKGACTGFFEWYAGGWEGVSPIARPVQTSEAAS